MIGLINYGSGNIYAIANIYKRLDIPHKLLTEPHELEGMDKLILPGVGAFDETMSLLNNSGMKEALDEYVLEKKTPIMGVCVGMQIMGKSSDEGDLAGFGWVDGIVRQIDEKELNHKPHLPHMGWNAITPQKQSPILDGIDTEQGFYFLHSYYFDCANEADILTTTHYAKNFASSFQADNVYGIQFHPEKSHSNGLTLFRNFANL